MRVLNLSLFVLIALFTSKMGLFAQAPKPELTWRFTTDTQPFMSSVKIEHERNTKALKSKTTVEIDFHLKPTALSDKGDATWALGFQSVKVSIREGRRRLDYDSQKGAALPEEARLRPFAEFFSKKLTVVVSPRGKLLKVENKDKCPSMITGAGGLDIGQSPEVAIAGGLVGEMIQALFLLPVPGKKGEKLPCYGATGKLPGISAFTLTLGEVPKAHKPRPSEAKGLPCSIVRWSCEIWSSETELSMGGPGLKLAAAKVGKVQGVGKYALDKGINVSRVESKTYTLPLPGGKVDFKRKITVNFRDFSAVEKDK